MVPDITVVIPLYNKERGISRCIASVVNQTHRPADIIVVDDGSTDASLENAKLAFASYSGKYSIFRRSNSGVSSARNFGVMQASTGLVAFLDADDEYLPSFLERMGRLCHDYPVGSIFSCSHQLVRGGVGRVVRPQVEGGFRGVLPDYFGLASKSSVINSSKVVVRKDALEAVGGFPEGATVGEDLFVWLMIAERFNVVFEDFLGAVVNQEADESRGSRFSTVSYPLTFFSTGRDDLSGLSRAAVRYLWSIFFVHFFSALRDGRRDVAASYALVTRRIFPVRVLFATLSFALPTAAFRFFAKLIGRNGR